MAKANQKFNKHENKHDVRPKNRAIVSVGAKPKKAEIVIPATV